MSEIQSRTSRQAIRQTADLAPLSPRYFPVALGQTWTYRSVTQQDAGDAAAVVERERVAGVAPASGDGASWVVNMDHEIEYADRSRESFATSLRVGERVVSEDDYPFFSVEPSWERLLDDGTRIAFEAREGVSVTVPAGTYGDCRHVHEVARRDGVVLYERDDWYAPAIGRVQSRYRRTSALGSLTEERQLIATSSNPD